MPLILDDSLIMTTTQRIFYHADQRDDLLNNGIGRHVFRPCSHWNWTPGEPEVEPWQQSMPSVEELVTEVLRGKFTPHSSENDRCLYAQSYVPKMCYCCSTEYTLRVWNHGDLGIELSLETWTKLGSCRTTGEIWWLTAAQHTCDTYSPNHCQKMQLELPWGDPATGAPKFDFLLRQSSTSVLDPSFLRAFEGLCSEGGFADTSATAPDNYAIRTRKTKCKVQTERYTIGRHAEEQSKEQIQQTEQKKAEKKLIPQYKTKAEQYRKKAEQYQRKAEHDQKMAEQVKQYRRQGPFDDWRALLQKLKQTRVYSQ